MVKCLLLLIILLLIHQMAFEVQINGFRKKRCITCSDVMKVFALLYLSKNESRKLANPILDHLLQTTTLTILRNMDKSTRNIMEGLRFLIL